MVSFFSATSHTVHRIFTVVIMSGADLFLLVSLVFLLQLLFLRLLRSDPCSYCAQRILFLKDIVEHLRISQSAEYLCCSGTQAPSPNFLVKLWRPRRNVYAFRKLSPTDIHVCVLVNMTSWPSHSCGLTDVEHYIYNYRNNKFECWLFGSLFVFGAEICFWTRGRQHIY